MSYRSFAPKSFLLILLAVLGLAAACSRSESPDASAVASSEVERAHCGSGSSPETGLQGQVPLADRQSGRSQQGYNCNLQLVGQYQGAGSSVVSPSLGSCAYLSASGTLIDPLQAVEPNPGVNVVDVSDPAHPVLSANLIGPSMLIGTWESLKTNEARKLLGGVAVGIEVGGGFFDVYDISDCAHPVQQNSLAGTPLELPDNIMGHEGNWSPDGKTYWSTGNVLGSITAIDTTNPQTPQIVYTGIASFPANHGVEFSADGNTLYLATCFGGGVQIIDVSDVQSRKPVPSLRVLGSVGWNPNSCGQHALPVTSNGKPYLIVSDEFNSEGIHIVDISDPTKPTVVKQIQLEIQRPQYFDTRVADVSGNGLFGYEAHYCTVDTPSNPTALACGYFQSGIRVFDITNLLKPREIAYFNPPAQVGKGLSLQHSLHAWVGGLAPTISDVNNSPLGSNPGTAVINPAYVAAFVEGLPNLLTNISNGDPVSGNMNADWCSSPPRFVGNDQLWVSCNDNGFLALKFTNGAYPIK